MLITWGVVAQSPEPGAHVSNARPIKCTIILTTNTLVNNVLQYNNIQI